MEFVGFLNEYLFTDVKSYKVMSDGKYYFAMSVVKECGNTKPQMNICGVYCSL